MDTNELNRLMRKAIIERGEQPIIETPQEFVTTMLTICKLLNIGKRTKQEKACLHEVAVLIGGGFFVGSDSVDEALNRLNTVNDIIRQHYRQIEKLSH